MNSTYTIETEFEAITVASSLAISLIGSLAAVNVMEEFRTEVFSEERSKLLVMFSLLVSCVSIWSLHFIGMDALHMFQVFPSGERVEMYKYFNTSQTALSAAAAFLGVYFGSVVASRDQFFAQTNEKAVARLKAEIERSNPTAVLKMKRKEVKMFALLTSPWKIIQGGFLAGGGVGAMHFLGMQALYSQQWTIEWNIGLMVFACLLACIVATAGFFIVFRLLQWRPYDEIARCAAGLIITVAVASMHYTGMLAATYVPTGATDVIIPVEGFQTSQFFSTVAVVGSVGGTMCTMVYLCARIRIQTRGGGKVAKAIKESFKKLRDNLENAKDLREAKQIVHEAITAGLIVKSSTNTNSKTTASAKVSPHSTAASNVNRF